MSRKFSDFWREDGLPSHNVRSDKCEALSGKEPDRNVSAGEGGGGPTMGSSEKLRSCLNGLDDNTFKRVTWVMRDQRVWRSWIKRASTETEVIIDLRDDDELQKVSNEREPQSPRSYAFCQPLGWLLTSDVRFEETQSRHQQIHAILPLI